MFRKQNPAFVTSGMVILSMDQWSLGMTKETHESPMEQMQPLSQAYGNNRLNKGWNDYGVKPMCWKRFGPKSQWLSLEPHWNPYSTGNLGRCNKICLLLSLSLLFYVHITVYTCMCVYIYRYTKICMIYIYIYTYMYIVYVMIGIIVNACISFESFG